MQLRKDGPVYYKDKITKLIKQALKENLKVKVKVLENGVKIYFKADNGEIAGVKLLEE